MDLGMVQRLFDHGELFKQRRNWFQIRTSKAKKSRRFRDWADVDRSN